MSTPAAARTAAVGLLTGLVVLGAASPAAAHTRLAGAAPADGSTVSLSGSSLTQEQLVGRTAMAVAYVVACMLSVAAVALFASTVTSSSIGAALATIGLLIFSTVLLGLDAAGPLHPFLPTRYWLAFVDFFRDPVPTREIFRGVALQAVYVAVFLGAAWANLSTKDVTS